MYYLFALAEFLVVFQTQKLVVTAVTLRHIVGLVHPVTHLHTALMEVSIDYVDTNNKHSTT